MDLQILVWVTRCGPETRRFPGAAARAGSVLGAAAAPPVRVGNAAGSRWLPERFAVCWCPHWGRAGPALCQNNTQADKIYFVTVPSSGTNSPIS